MDMDTNIKSVENNLALTRRLLIGILGVVLVSLQANVALAEGQQTCYVDKLKYTNKGGYNVVLAVVKLNPTYGKWENDYPNNPSDSNPNNKKVSRNQSQTVDLTHMVDSGKGLGFKPSYAKLRQGDEVWLHVDIVLGEKKSCRKDTHKLVYKRGVNKTMEFFSKGTVTDGNRCRFRGDMHKECYTGD